MICARITWTIEGTILHMIVANKRTKRLYYYWVSTDPGIRSCTTWKLSHKTLFAMDVMWMPIKYNFVSSLIWGCLLVTCCFGEVSLMLISIATWPRLRKDFQWSSAVSSSPLECNGLKVPTFYSFETWAKTDLYQMGHTTNLASIFIMALILSYLVFPGLMWENAPRFGALLVFAEHRCV